MTINIKNLHRNKVTKEVDWSGFVSPRERAELEKERNAPSPYQSYSYTDWKKLAPADPKLPKPQSEFERDYDLLPKGTRHFITSKWEAPEDEQQAS